MEGLEDGEEEERAAHEEDEGGRRHGAEADERLLRRGANDELDLMNELVSHGAEEGSSVGGNAAYQPDPIPSRVTDVEEVKAISLSPKRPQLLLLSQ